MYLGPACFAWLTVGGALSEWPKIRAANAWAVPRAHPLLFGAAALTGFAINVSRGGVLRGVVCGPRVQRNRGKWLSSGTSCRFFCAAALIGCAIIVSWAPPQKEKRAVVG